MPGPAHQVVKIRAAVRGRTLVRWSELTPPRPLVVGFHGYGESAAPHLEALERIPGAGGWHLAAIQALHPFYTKSGEVVASWMTRLDREEAIADNLRYVGDVVERLATDDRVAPPLVFAGFSQGVAMAYRAAAASGVPLAAVLALAGDVPPELAEADLSRIPRVLLGRGRRDSWYDGGKMAADLELLAAKGVAVEECVFDGGHDWGEEFLVRCGRFLEGLAAA